MTGERRTMYTDSKYAFGVVHLWKNLGKEGAVKFKRKRNGSLKAYFRGIRNPIITGKSVSSIR